MGKGKRIRQVRAAELERKRREEEAKRQERKETIKLTLIVVAVLLAIAILAGTIVFTITAIKSTGKYLRKHIALQSENYAVNDAMLAYFFYDNFYMQKNIYDYYYLYYQYGVNTSKPLKSQKYGSDGETWFDFFMNQTVDNVKVTLYYAERAKELGIDLDDGDMLFIDKEIKTLQRSSDKENVSLEKYIYDVYGLGVKESDIRDALELVYLSMKVQNILKDEFEYTDEDLESYYEDKKTDFLYADYKSYTVKSYYPSDATDEEKEEAGEKAKAYAEKLSEAKSAKEFDIALKEYLYEVYTENEIAYTDEEINKTVEDTLTERHAYSESTDFDKWLFDEENDVKAGDTKVIDNEDGTYTVYLVVTAPGRLEYTTKNVRHILFKSDNYESDKACREAAEEQLEAFKAGDMTEERFAELAKKYTDDRGSEYLGGLYENIEKGEMVEEFEEWCYDTSRKAGDVDIIKTDYGYHIIYFIGDGLPAWKAAAYNALLNEYFDDIVIEYSKKYEITVNENKLGKVPDDAAVNR
ncbi:MAG: peptidylprolyl isomerase [Eubacteriales bacterium]|jgi:parvulin-like peptidyl-prolyl isomerase|nr:hypothetical protein [Clostridiales bacterium]